MSFIPTESTEKTSSYTTPNKSYNSNCNSYGSAINCSTRSGGGITFSKPSQNMTVKMFKDDEPIPATAFSCSIIYANLAPKYIKKSRRRGYKNLSEIQKKRKKY